MDGAIIKPGRLPLGCGVGVPSDIANACLFLASDASRYFTGRLPAVDSSFLIS